MRLLRAAAACLGAAVLFCIPAAAISARHSVVLDADTGQVLYENDAEARALIASTTKIMTGLLVAERCDLRQTVTISAQAVGIEGTSVGLQAGEQVSVETLLYGLMLHSGNDAAVALAIHAAGSQEIFVSWMNEKAKGLGLTGTHYANPHGLDAEDHYSTALDLAQLAAYAMENPVFRQVVSTRSITVGGRTFTNHNKLLWRYPGALGIKTGYTRAAGRILVSCAERGGYRLICVTIDDPNDWQDHCVLLDRGFAALEQRDGAGEDS